MNETASILILAIVGIWFFTSERFQAFKTVLAYTPATTTKSSSIGGYTPEERQKAEDLEKAPLNGNPGVAIG